MNTLNCSEFQLSIAATLAENDLKEGGSRQRFSLRNRCENGYISIGSMIFGYIMTKDNQLIINEAEADTVRFIFDSYINGMSLTKIANALNEKGIPTKKNATWRATAIRRMLSNEKYMGDSRMLKTLSINGEQVKNDDIEPQFYIVDSHEGIVSKEVFNKAQELLATRANPKLVGGVLEHKPFSYLIECAECGKGYIHKINSSGTLWQTPIWACGHKLKNGKSSCKSSNIKDSILKEKFIECFNEFINKKYTSPDVAALKAEHAELLKEERDLLGLYTKGMITEEAYLSEHAIILRQIKANNKKFEEAALRNVSNRDHVKITEFDEEKLSKFIKKVIVKGKTVTFVFINDVEISREFTNGTAGNQKGWKQKKLLREAE